MSSPLLLVNCFPTPVVMIHIHGQLELSSPHPWQKMWHYYGAIPLRPTATISFKPWLDNNERFDSRRQMGRLWIISTRNWAIPSPQASPKWTKRSQIHITPFPWTIIFNCYSHFKSQKQIQRLDIQGLKVSCDFKYRYLLHVFYFRCVIKSICVYGVMAIEQAKIAKILIHFLDDLIKWRDKTSKGSESKVCFIIDNASIHKTTDVKWFADKRSLCLLTIPSYSPSLNSAGTIIQTIKSKVKKRRNQGR